MILTPATPATAATVRDPRIDILRGIAIGCVLLLHFALAYGLKDSALGDLLPPRLLSAVVFNGNYGVTMFFAVSGFLITSISLRRWGSLAGIDIKAFYALRAARILPPLLPVLAVIVVLGCLGVPRFTNTDGGHHFPSSFFMLAAGSVLTFWHNVLMQKVGYFNYCLNVYWSLSVEEAFYLLMPLSCVALRRNALALLVCLGFIALGPWYRHSHATDEIDYLYAYPACFDAISFGCIAGFASVRHPFTGRAATAVRWGAAAAGVAVYLAGIRDHVTWGFTAMGALTATWLWASAQAAPLGRVATAISTPLRWLGRHSYEVYLVHIVVLGGLLNLLGRADLDRAARLPWLGLFVALSCVAASALARLASVRTTPRRPSSPRPPATPAR